MDFLVRTKKGTYMKTESSGYAPVSVKNVAPVYEDLSRELLARACEGDAWYMIVLNLINARVEVRAVERGTITDIFDKVIDHACLCARQTGVGNMRRLLIDVRDMCDEDLRIILAGISYHGHDQDGPVYALSDQALMALERVRVCMAPRAPVYGAQIKNGHWYFTNEKPSDADLEAIKNACKKVDEITQNNKCNIYSNYEIDYENNRE